MDHVGAIHIVGPDLSAFGIDRHELIEPARWLTGWIKELGAVATQQQGTTDLG